MNFWLVTLGVLVIFASRPAAACSSCGSGGADPLVLFPYEDLKVLGQLTHQKGFRDINPDGVETRSFGPEIKYLYTGAIAYRLTERAFSSLTLPYQTSIRGDSQLSGWGDPLLAVRYNLLQQNMLQPYRPQVQLLAAYKQANSRSIHGSRRFDNLDVASNGFDESTLGADLWFGMTRLLAGATYMWTAPTNLQSSFGRIDRQQEHRGILTAGYQWDQIASVIGGIRLRSHDGLSLNGQRQAKSAVSEGSWFFTAESRLPMPVNFRLTISETASVGDNRNTARFWSVSLAAIGRIL